MTTRNSVGYPICRFPVPRNDFPWYEQSPSKRLLEAGNLVPVRSRRWLVQEVVQPEKAGQSPVVQLARADDDAQGQSLEVFWEYELDWQILEEEGWHWDNRETRCALFQYLLNPLN